MKTTIAFLLLCPVLLLAQSNKLPTERVFIASEHTEYKSGDTIVVRGQVITSDTVFYPYSKYVYVELFNDRDSVFLRQKVVCGERGDFYTGIPMEYELPDQVYYLRAYTRLMQNFNTETYPIIPIRLGAWKAEAPTGDILCSLFPEGGHWGDGIPQNIGVSFTNNDKEPVPLSYVVTNQRDDTICVQTTTSSGWQIISMTPQKGDRYTVSATVNGDHYRFLLPDRQSVPTLQATIRYDRLVYKVLFAEQMRSKAHLYLFHQDIGLQEITLNNNEGVVQLDGFSEGVVLLTLTNDTHDVLAQRTLWLEDTPIGESYEMKSEYAPGEPLELDGLLEPDKSAFTYVRLLPADHWYIPYGEVSLKFESELRSSGSFPLYYCRESNEERRVGLNAWLLSATSKRLDIKKLLKTGFSYTYAPEENMVLKGQVKTKGGRPVANGTLVAYNTENGLTYNADMNKKGEFMIGVDDFEEGNTFFLQAYGLKEKSDYYDYQLLNDTFPAIRNWNKIREDNYIVEVESGVYDKSTFRFDGDNKLPEVVVKAKVRSKAYVPTNKFYAHRYLDQEILAKRNYTTFFQLIHEFPSLKISQNEETKMYVIESIRKSSLFSPDSVVILVDGCRMTADELFNSVSLNDVYSVEFLSHWQALAVVAGAINGALVIKTKMYQVNRDEVIPKGVLYTPTGIANLRMPPYPLKTHAPMEKGTYRLVVDRISKEKGIRTVEKLIMVE